jgi:hypothetical protein
MHKSILTFLLLASSLVMLTVMPFLNNNNSFSPTEAKAESEYGLMMDDNYKSKYSSFEKKEVIECNNFNLNVNDNDDGGGDVAVANTGNNANNNNDENNKDDDIVGQLLEPKQGEEEEEETEINRHSSSISEYDSKDSQSTVICKSFNNNEVPSSTDTETLTVIKKTACQADTQTCQQIQIQPSNFTIVIDGNNPIPDEFSGESTGTNVELEAGPYNVTEQGLDPNTPPVCANMSFEAGSDLGNNLVICTNFSQDCSGDISAGENLSCTIDNVVIDTTATLTVNKEVFGCSIFSDLSMNCRDLQNNSTRWISCNDASINGTRACQSLNVTSFDIEVLNSQNNRVVEPFEGSAAGTTIQNLQPGNYTINEIESTTSDRDQLGDFSTDCAAVGFPDGGTYFNTNPSPPSIFDLFYTICFEYEDEQGNDCSTITLAAGEQRTCTVKNYIRAVGPFD